jgi:hypothetical protein
MRMPIVEAAFSHPWTAAARRVLPSPSPQFTATAMWGPLLGWCMLELLAESIDAGNPQQMALDLFDRLRLREPFAQAFSALGFESEEGWRVASRIKVVLLSEAGVGQPQATSAPQPDAGSEAPVKPAGVDEAPTPQTSHPTPGDEPARAEERVALAPSLWLDPDVRWLTGAHEADGHSYLVREPYEELLWWMLMPSLLRLAGESVLDRSALAEMARFVDEALASAEAAGYRIDALLGPSGEANADVAEAEAQPVKHDAEGPDRPESEEPKPEA